MGRKKLVNLQLGPLPVEAINHALGLELEPGDVRIDVAHQIHSQRRHPAEYSRCLPHVALVIANPQFIGDDFRNPGIEIVSRIPALGAGLLVAVTLKKIDGFYSVSSFYPVSEQKIQNRLIKGHLKRVVSRTTA